MNQEMDGQLCKVGHRIFDQDCKSCEDLKTEWYNYAKQMGFVDIEKGNNLSGSVVTLGVVHNPVEDRLNTFSARVNYYQWAREKINEGKFQTTKDRLIWEDHAHGATLREIAPKVGYEFSWISRKIKRIEGYLKDQMNLITSSASYSCSVG